MGNREQLDEMGKKILDASRTELYLSMRFLGPALHSLGFIMDLSTKTVGTDAAYIRFNPHHLFSLYVDRPRLLNRTYLHMLLHCVFRHMFTAKKKEDRELWDLACDIAVSSIIDSMDYPAVAELTPELRQRVYDRLQDEIHVLTAEKIYQYFVERKRNYLEELQLAAVFAYDDHSFWERMEDEEDQNSEGGGDKGQDDPQAEILTGKTPAIGLPEKTAPPTERADHPALTAVKAMTKIPLTAAGKTEKTGIRRIMIPRAAVRRSVCPASDRRMIWKETGRRLPGAWRRRSCHPEKRPLTSGAAWTGSCPSPTAAGRTTGNF